MKRPPVTYCSLECRAPPSANACFRNAAGKGRVKTKVYTDWITAAAWDIAVQNPGCVSGPYHLLVTVKRANLRKDLDNFIKPISDLLVTMGVVDDDRFCESISAQWSDKWTGVRVTVIAAAQARREAA